MSEDGQYPAPPQAKELTVEEVAAKRERAYELALRIRDALAAGYRVEWVLAESIYEFDEDNLWIWLSDDYNKLEDYLASPEVGMSRSWWFRYRQMWKELVVDRKVAAPRLEGLEPSKVAEVLPAITRGEIDVEDALSDVEVLGWRDLRDRYKKAPDTTSKLAAEEEPERSKCPACGTWVDADTIDQDVIEGSAEEVPL